MSRYQLSPHFYLDEWRCKDGSDVPTVYLGNVEELAREILEPVRAAWGGPLIVVSGYRTPEYNKGRGVPHSAHLTAEAADIRPGDPDSSEALWSCVRHMYAAGKLPKLGGLGRYPSWVHVDIRRSKGRLREWSGAGMGSEP